MRAVARQRPVDADGPGRRRGAAHPDAALRCRPAGGTRRSPGRSSTPTPWSASRRSPCGSSTSRRRATRSASSPWVCGGFRPSSDCSSWRVGCRRRDGKRPNRRTTAGRRSEPLAPGPRRHGRGRRDLHLLGLHRQGRLTRRRCERPRRSARSQREHSRGDERAERHPVGAADRAVELVAQGHVDVWR